MKKITSYLTHTFFPHVGKLIKLVTLLKNSSSFMAKYDTKKLEHFAVLY